VCFSYYRVEGGPSESYSADPRQTAEDFFLYIDIRLILVHGVVSSSK